MPYNYTTDFYGAPQGLSYQDFWNRPETKGSLDILRQMQARFGGNPMGDIYTRYQSQAQGKPEGSFYNTELPDPTKYFDPAMLNKFFDTARGNLGQQQASTAANAARRAGASSAGFLNPASFVNMASTQATAPYAEQFGRLETGRAQGQQGLQQLLYQMLAQKAGAERGGEDAQRNYYLQLQQLAQQQSQFQQQQDANTPGFWEYFLSSLPGLGSILSIPGLLGKTPATGK